jgi:hypothetical protein
MVSPKPDRVIKPLKPEEYLDVVYGPGYHVVLLHRGDNLAREAASNLRATDPRLGLRSVRLWVCFIETPEHAETIQVVKLPQFRFFRNGHEEDSRVGVMTTEAIAQVINAMIAKQLEAKRR